MRMDEQNTSMSGWIILSAAVLVALGVGLYFIVKHLNRCKPNCSGDKCEDGCGKKCSTCKTGCDKHGKCKHTAAPTEKPTPTPTSTGAQLISTWNNPVIQTTHKNKIKTLLSKGSNGANQNLNGPITDSVLSCVLAKIINMYKKPADFDAALSNPAILTVLIKIVNDCINGTTTDPTQGPTQGPTRRPKPTIDPNTVCDPECDREERCIQKGCVPRTWTREFYNNFRDSMMSDPAFKKIGGGTPISKHLANCITDSFKNKYNNPQKMVDDLDDPDALIKLFKNFHTKCTQVHPPPPNPCGITISDSCKSKGQNKVNRGFLGCDDEIIDCEGGAGGTISDDCLDSLRDIASYTCDNMIRHKPGRHDDDRDDRDKGWYYCNAAVPDSTNPYAPPCGSCMFVTDRSQVPAGHPTVPGVLDADGRLNCEGVNYCADSMDCNLPITSGIY